MSKKDQLDGAIIELNQMLSAFNSALPKDLDQASDIQQRPVLNRKMKLTLDIFLNQLSRVITLMREAELSPAELEVYKTQLRQMLATIEAKLNKFNLSEIQRYQAQINAFRDQFHDWRAATVLTPEQIAINQARELKEARKDKRDRLDKHIQTIEFYCKDFEAQVKVIRDLQIKESSLTGDEVDQQRAELKRQIAHKEVLYMGSIQSALVDLEKALVLMADPELPISGGSKIKYQQDLQRYFQQIVVEFSKLPPVYSERRDYSKAQALIEKLTPQFSQRRVEVPIAAAPAVPAPVPRGQEDVRNQINQQPIYGRPLGREQFEQEIKLISKCIELLKNDIKEGKINSNTKDFCLKIYARLRGLRKLSVSENPVLAEPRSKEIIALLQKAIIQHAAALGIQIVSRDAKENPQRAEAEAGYQLTMEQIVALNIQVARQLASMPIFSKGLPDQEISNELARLGNLVSNLKLISHEIFRPHLSAIKISVQAQALVSLQQVRRCLNNLMTEFRSVHDAEMPAKFSASIQRIFVVIDELQQKLNFNPVKEGLGAGLYAEHNKPNLPTGNGDNNDKNFFKF